VNAAGGSTNVTFGDKLPANEMDALDIQDRYLFYAQNVAKIEQTLTGYESCYLVKAHLSPVGMKIGAGRFTRAVYGAFIFFILTALFFYWKYGRNNLA
jgi:hypothetical protein